MAKEPPSGESGMGRTSLKVRCIFLIMAHNRDSVKRFLPTFCALQKAGKMPLGGGGKSTRSVPSRQGHRRRRQKDLIGLMRSCCLGVLIRGLENLESPCEGVRVVTFCVVQKVTKKHAGLRPATSIQISARFKILAKMTGHDQVTGRAGYCKVSGYRR